MFGFKTKHTKRVFIGIALALALGAPVESRLPQTAETTAKLTLSVGEMQELMKNDKDLIDQRTRAEKMLKANAKDYKAHLLLGYVLHHAEGDLARARYHLDKSHKYVLKAVSNDMEARQFYGIICFELLMVLTEMDQYEDKITLLREMSSTMSNKELWMSEMAWPLMKLDKEKEARQIIQQILSSGNPGARINAWNTLGALESDLGHYQAAYDAFDGLLKEAARYSKPNITFYRNMGEACLPLGLYEDAEKYYSQAAKLPFEDDSFSNPYQDLTSIYLSQARFSEAMNAMKKTVEWSNATKPFLYQQSMADNTQLKGMLQLELGLPAEAVDTLQLLVQRPDRRGGTSLRIDQTEAGNLLCWRTALKTNLQRNQERLAATSFFSGAFSLIRYGWQRLTKGKTTLSTDAMYVSLVWENIQMRRQIDQAEKRIAALSANSQRIRASMLPYDTQSVITTEWMRPNLMGIWGTGLSQAAIEDIRQKPPERYAVAEPFLAALQGEIAFLNGSYRRSAELFSVAMKTLPRQEALLRYRTETRLAMALLKCGKESEALQLFQHVISGDGAMLREAEARLPIIAKVNASEQSSSFNSAVLKGLKRSPRFKVGSRGLQLIVSSAGKEDLRVAVSDSSGNSIKVFHVSLKNPNAPLAEVALAGIHDGLCAPNINISGLADSLDGTMNSANVRDLIQYY